MQDYATLAFWSLEQGPQRQDIGDINSNLRGSLIIKRVADTSNVEASKLTMDASKLAHETAKREEIEKQE